MYDTKKLLYHEKNEKKLRTPTHWADLRIAKGIINLHDVIGYGYGTELQYNSPFGMKLKTSTRVWPWKCEHKSDWKIKCYPNGNKKYGRGDVCLFLAAVRLPLGVV
eukprot:1060962_1